MFVVADVNQVDCCVTAPGHVFLQSFDSLLGLSTFLLYELLQRDVGILSVLLAALGLLCTLRHLVLVGHTLGWLCNVYPFRGR